MQQHSIKFGTHFTWAMNKFTPALLARWNVFLSLSPTFSPNFSPTFSPNQSPFCLPFYFLYSQIIAMCWVLHFSPLWGRYLHVSEVMNNFRWSSSLKKLYVNFPDVTLVNKCLCSFILSQIYSQLPGSLKQRWWPIYTEFPCDICDCMCKIGSFENIALKKLIV